MVDNTAAAWAEIEAISDNVRRALECPICLQLAPNMTCPCPNGHPMCHTCADMMSNQNVMQKCPMCRSPIFGNDGTLAFVTAIKFDQIKASLRMACAHRRYGCNELTAIPDMIDHEQFCRYKPTVYCKVSGCQWLGVHDQLFGHVLDVHPAVVIDTACTSLIVEDVNNIAQNRRRTYLVRAPHGVFWVLLSRASRNRIHTAVAVVIRNKLPTEANCGQPLDIRYRIMWVDANGYTRGRNRLQTVNRWVTGPQYRDSNGVVKLDIHSIVRSQSGRIKIGWFASPSV
ncbi:TRAF-like,Zinc finger, RING-type,Zinc finger, RING/FYVE/PHD-type,Seven-in-absentia protein, TRAF-like [Cinara cedri]|uniref:TRAF-like,Zinc finger, RING-type,Zinc finger, RING/FYVE/PHD-type,Seven-in-absentia protein, TRAF-like n=1 Tax=Cinara cedri TaxID=506608 RepID=A0A5E4N737_9HEMI|nr:TRAF-like,Zinc finger, RING-type,Zinc finger, RING/FYVE/PHD-type,Seven-in-absentia protein, TRAF-like [Cinara cedri]